MVVVIVVTALLPVALIVGVALQSLIVRRSIASMPRSFRCKLRADKLPVADPKADKLPVADLSARWPRSACRAAWVHDSLVVASGFWRVRVHALAVHFAEGALESAPIGAVRGLGQSPVMLSLQLDDGSQAVLAAPRSARNRVAGPYLVAELHVEPRTARNEGDDREGPVIGRRREGVAHGDNH